MMRIPARIASLCALSATFLSFAGPVGVVPNRLLVKPKAGAPQNAVADAVRPYSGKENGLIPGTGVRIVNVPPHALGHALRGLQRNPRIEFAEPDYILAPDATVTDPHFGNQWHLPKVGVPSAWDTTFGSSDLVIAILDTGVDSNHPELAGKLVPGWNAYDDNFNTADVHGHGTAVAGSAAAAANNGVGVAGVAPDCKIMPIRISDPSGYAYWSTVATALNWAGNNGARVANISYTVSGSSTIRSAAQNFQSKGGVVAAAAGNDGLFDSAGDNPYILTVSATSSSDAIASWSNTGNNIDLAAPGTSILTTSRGGGYAKWTGTSFSAPIVAGAAALVMSAQPGLSGAQAAEVLKKSALDLGTSGFDTQYGHGRLDVSAAILLALSSSTPEPRQPAPEPVGDSTIEPAPEPIAVDTTAPSISISSPAHGSRVSVNTTISVDVSDDVKVTLVELYVNGELQSSSSNGNFTFKWNTKKISNGVHTLQTKAYDAAGNSGLSQIIAVYK